MQEILLQALSGALASACRPSVCACGALRVEDEAEQGRREKQAEADGVQEPSAVMLEREGGGEMVREGERESERERERERRESEYLCREVLGGVVRAREAAEELRVEVEEKGVRAAAAQRCTHDEHLAVTLALLEHRVMGLEAEKEEATRRAQLQVFVCYCTAERIECSMQYRTRMEEATRRAQLQIFV
jgi:hypothetical protein